MKRLTLQELKIESFVSTPTQAVRGGVDHTCVCASVTLCLTNHPCQYDTNGGCP